MGQEVTIHLESRQRSGDRIEVMQKDLPGTYFCKEKARYLMYEERPGQRMTIKVKESSLTLIQSGQNSWNHSFRTGETSASNYITPYGSFWLEVTTNSLKVEESEESFLIQLSYSLFTGEEDGTQIDLNLTVSKRGGRNENSYL